MKRIPFFVLWATVVFGHPARGDIEIYANGHKYASLQAYQAPRKNVMPAHSSVDLSKIETLQVNQNNMPDNIRHKLYVLSVENGVVDALRGFQMPRILMPAAPVNTISPEQMPEAIQQAVTRTKGPTLLISEPGKVRVMALTAKDTGT